MPEDANVELSIMGYLIEKDIIYDVREKRLASIGGMVKEIRLRRTQALVLEYLLANAINRFVSDDSLMTDVWENNGLRGSTQRVWQVINDLKNKAGRVGVSDEFILRVSKKGYFIRPDSVEVLLCASECSPV
jgi:DNA-binding winged helix-turn-helix (wHTH) protein